MQEPEQGPVNVQGVGSGEVGPCEQGQDVFERAQRATSVMLIFSRMTAIRELAREFRGGREKDLLATATVQWHSSPPEETMTWVLLDENVLGPQMPPVATFP